jgi:hypothetical protein
LARTSNSTTLQSPAPAIGLPGWIPGQQSERWGKLVPEPQQHPCSLAVSLLVHQVEAESIGDAVDEVEGGAHIDNVSHGVLADPGIKDGTQVIGADPFRCERKLADQSQGGPELC